MAEAGQTTTAGREIALTRTFDAPRELVFGAWTIREHLAQWWGPNGFTITTYEMDLRPGGVWRFVMHGPDGVDHPNRITYDEIVEPERLVYTHGPRPVFQTTVNFTAHGNKTELSVRMLFRSVAERDKTIEVFHADEGLSQTLERLAAHLRDIREGNQS